MGEESGESALDGPTAIPRPAGDTPMKTLTMLAALGVLALTPAAFADDCKKDIVDTAVAAGKFKTLAAALKAAGLVEALKGDGPLTVFAPTDDAFAKLPEGTVESLLKPENKEKLKAVLLYHVVPGKVTAADVVKLKEARTLNGGTLSVSVKGETVKVNDSKVIAVDVKASNGVIHVIDTVLIPK